MSARYQYVEQFADFQDHPESPFYASAALGLGPVETWEHITRRMDELIGRVCKLYSPTDPFQISPDVLCSWHEEIFGDAFPCAAGRLRWRRDGDWDNVFFGADIGTIRSRQIKQLRGAHPRKIRALLGRACREATNAVGEIQRQLRAAEEPDFDEAVYAAARLYCKILRIHPWPDGNLRTAFVALQATLAALDLAAVEFKDLARHDDMLGIAFQGDHRPYAGLAALIAEILQEAA